MIVHLERNGTTSLQRMIACDHPHHASFTLIVDHTTSLPLGASAIPQNNRHGTAHRIMHALSERMVIRQGSIPCASTQQMGGGLRGPA